MRKALTSLVLLICLGALSPGHAAATLVNGYAELNHGVYGDPEDRVTVRIGSGGPANAPAAADAGDVASGVVTVKIERAAGPEINVVVPLVAASVTTEGAYRVFDARGVGSDGNCWGFSIASDSTGNVYAGMVIAGPSTVRDPNGGCIARTRDFALFGEMKFTDV